MPTDPTDLAAHLRDLERRIDDLERAPRLTNASITDDNDVERIEFGALDDNEPPTDFGLVIRNADGVAVLYASADGVMRPYQTWQASQWAESIPVTSGTFGPTWALSNPYSTADALQVSVAIGADAATTGEARLSANISGSPVTATLTIPAGTLNYYEWKWAPVGLVAGTGPIIVTLDVRRTAGAGTVHAYCPIQAFSAVAADIGATATGI
jgi:hypothetical protein